MLQILQEVCGDDGILSEASRGQLRVKINSDKPIISQFVTSKTIYRNNDLIYRKRERQINNKLVGELFGE
jgi:hypothetical protein